LWLRRSASFEQLRSRLRTVMSGSRAGDGGRLAATCGAASHVTSWQRTRPLTSRGKEEGGQWFREKSGRRVLKLRLESSCHRQRYWRAPRPRLRPHRRRQRRQDMETLQAALPRHTTSRTAASTDAELVIQVLQRSLCTALQRAQVAEKSAATAKKILRAVQPHVGPELELLFAEHNEEVQALTDKLERAGRKLHRSKTRFEKQQRAYQGELSVAAEMLQRWQQHANKCMHKRTRLKKKYEQLKKAHRQPPSHSSTCTSACLWMRPWFNPPDAIALGIITMYLAFIYL
jgi:hypothetical protein